MYYDNILKRPVCEQNVSRSLSGACSLRHVNATKFSSIQKSVRIYQSSRECKCDDKNYEKFKDEFCIKSELLKDFKKFQIYVNLPLTKSLNLESELKYIAFFCQILHQRDFCNHLANLCVLTHFDTSFNGPCSPFFQQQFQKNEEFFEEGTKLGGGGKLKPFVFFTDLKAAKNHPLRTAIDFSYTLNNVSSQTTQEFLIFLSFHQHFRPTTLLTSPWSLTIWEEIF